MDPRASRIYAWWVLVQTWCTLRFSDHRGISPQEVKMDSSGFAAVLRRSKTIGADKPIVSRPHKACWVSKSDWLMTGWRILQEAAGFERDYLLPVPTASFRGCKRIELNTTNKDTRSRTRSCESWKSQERNSSATRSRTSGHHTLAERTSRQRHRC